MFVDLDAAVMGAFGEPVIWRRGGGAESSVSAILDIQDMDEQGAAGSAGASNQVWTLSIPATSLLGLDRKQDRFLVRGRLCKAPVTPGTDAAGMLFITLEFVS